MKKLGLASSKECSGCGACRAACGTGAISMRQDEEGFYKPVVDDGRCVKCGKCAAVCPVMHRGKKRRPLAVYALKAKDGELRRGSASGGAFTLLAGETLRRGGVVFGAGFDHSDWRVVHKAAENFEELDELRGSKYVQSDTGDTFREAKRYLDEGREVLYSGCPCQIAGLRGYLGKEYANLLTVELICHGIPSPLAWGRYVEECQANSAAPITRIYSRRYSGWRDYAIGMQRKGEDDVSFSSASSGNPYLVMFTSFRYLREGCYHCAFRGLSSMADAVIGDYYGISADHPDFEDNLGVSAYIAASEQGLAAFREIVRDAEVLEIDYGRLCSSNYSIIGDGKACRTRKYFYRYLKHMRFSELVKKMDEYRHVGLLHHLLWWCKRLVFNFEINRIKWR